MFHPLSLSLFLSSFLSLHANPDCTLKKSMRSIRSRDNVAAVSYPHSVIRSFINSARLSLSLPLFFIFYSNHHVGEVLLNTTQHSKQFNWQLEARFTLSILRAVTYVFCLRLFDHMPRPCYHSRHGIIFTFKERFAHLWCNGSRTHNEINKQANNIQTI